MTEKEIIEGNKLIEIFKADNSTAVANYVNDKSGEYCMNILCYHKDWSLLMPVVEKIENMGYYVTIRDKRADIHNATHNGKRLAGNIDTSKINATWKACIQFIKWHNSLTSK